jgi:Squalene-hopene cyclase C-terminal domain
VRVMSNLDQMEKLLKDLAGNRVTQFSPSVYETGQYLRVSGRREIAERQTAYLLALQRRDGLWGAAGYELIPTLSAIAGLSSTAEISSQPSVADSLARASRRLWELALSGPGLPALPDTVASELIAPSLVEATRGVLDQYRPGGPTDNGRGPAFPYPPRARPEFWRQLSDQICGGGAIPKKICHSLEVFHPLPADFARMVSAAEDGAVACSPAATAAWFSAADPGVGHRSLAYLREVESRHGGAIPMGTSMPYFELLWVLNLTLKYFPKAHVPEGLSREIAGAFGESGIGGGPGIPPDGDDTAYAMLAFEKMGTPTDPRVLLQFWEDDRFISYRSEQTPSETTNAHALEYLSHLRIHRGHDQFGHIEDACIEWLLAYQSTDGCWHDKWHVSPYYATAACVEALLVTQKTGRPLIDAVRRAREWLLETQTPEGGWGMGEASREETAYGVMALNCLASADGFGADADAARAIVRAKARLAESSEEKPALWMGKDLYTPYRIVDSVELCGREIANRY